MFKTRTVLAHAMYEQMASGDVKALYDQTVLEDLGMTADEMQSFLKLWSSELEAVEGDYEMAVRDVGQVLANKLMHANLSKV